MSWAQGLRRDARKKAKELGHELAPFKEGTTTWLTSCWKCDVWVEVGETTYYFSSKKPCEEAIHDSPLSEPR